MPLLPTAMFHRPRPRRSSLNSPVKNSIAAAGVPDRVGVRALTALAVAVRAAAVADAEMVAGFGPEGRITLALRHSLSRVWSSIVAIASPGAPGVHRAFRVPPAKCSAPGLRFPSGRFGGSTGNRRDRRRQRWACRRHSRWEWDTGRQCPPRRNDSRRCTPRPDARRPRPGRIRCRRRCRSDCPRNRRPVGSNWLHHTILALAKGVGWRS